MRFIILRIDKKYAQIVDEFRVDESEIIEIRAEYLTEKYLKIALPD